MSKITVRFSDQEEADLRGRAESASLSISELIRGTMFPGTVQNLPGLPATSGQVSELAGQLSALAQVVERMATAQENVRVVEKKEVGPGPVSGPEKNAQADQTGPKVAALSRQVDELSRLILTQKNRPFGLDLPFVQATLMAVFTLARGSFTRYPEEWEPHKDEAWRRAFAPSEDACSGKS
jgi:hypothetical protein